jgi:glycosyltransferase involved in cell wall biosynthesis
MVFSVITVTYNSSQFVRESIESVLASSYTNFEYIIGDDCSTDNTWEIIQEYNDPRIVRYRNEHNLREYPNRNKAISMAKGEWILFIDGDDILFEHGLEVFAFYAKKSPNIGMIIQKTYQNNIVFPIVLSPVSFLLNEFFDTTRLSCSSLTSNVFNREKLNEIGLLPIEYITGDEFIRLKLGAKHPTLFISGFLTWPRETPNQASSKISYEKSLGERFEHIDFLIQNTRFDNSINKIHGAIYKKMQDEYIKFIFHQLKRFNIYKIYLFSKAYLKRYMFSITSQKGVGILEGHKPENPFKGSC